MSRLTRKHALVTGGARGIGRAIAERFIAEGAIVTIADIREPEGRSAAEALGTGVHFTRMDVTDADAWEGAVAQAWERQPIDVLVNNAGAVISFDPLEKTSVDLFRRVVDLNLTSCFLGMRTVIPRMLEAGTGSVINISSISGVVGHDVAPAYQAAKGGVRTLTKNAAVTFATRGVRVNSIHPGIIATPMVAEQPAWATEAFVAATPMGAPGEPDDIAHAAVYLASEESRFVTGAEMYVDGGFVAQ
ncbi:SDR family NAD(P)-dependent oxidoreductase [Amycolatopsis viridis]|uniref:NAD(P)-dependent dehydrogenase (Short-subunit alcohol dehydrogenase family) n=1 Tax=Amycolatopsis viridis TaxID=185678 RepID=A0ABX0T2X6_9PSEU|nr:glucose 1-dehydrogenase [Amycolatopsis viridis]NIH82255.1 NAD(P)-dependent dehydrogenase (short-subunit alcohol dehydrogenase family) [Amycolatopsis viridis]